MLPNFPCNRLGHRFPERLMTYSVLLQDPLVDEEFHGSMYSAL